MVYAPEGLRLLALYAPGLQDLRARALDPMLYAPRPYAPGAKPHAGESSTSPSKPWFPEGPFASGPPQQS